MSVSRPDDDLRCVAKAYLVLRCAASLQSSPVYQFIQSQLCSVYSQEEKAGVVHLILSFVYDEGEEAKVWGGKGQRKREQGLTLAEGIERAQVEFDRKDGGRARE